MTKSPVPLLVAVLVAVLAACDPTATGTATPSPTEAAAMDDPPVPATAAAATVEQVVDGDTVILDLDGERERARLLRIDAPEVAQDGQDADCLAEEATTALSTLLPTGTVVRVSQDVEERDRFGRLLVHVWADDVWINGAMLRQGLAEVLTIAPNVAYDSEAIEAQRIAVQAQVGLHEPGVC